MAAVSASQLSEQSILTLSLWVFGLGGLIVVLIVLFALFILATRQLQWWRKGPYPAEMLVHDLLHALSDPSRRRDALSVGAVAAAAYGEHLARRNEFWVSYGQTTVAVLLLIVVTVLLLTRTISPDAGLPILSGIGGFAIAKSSSTSRGISAPRGPEGEQG